MKERELEQVSSSLQAAQGCATGAEAGGSREVAALRDEVQRLEGALRQSKVSERNGNHTHKFPKAYSPEGCSQQKQNREKQETHTHTHTNLCLEVSPSRQHPLLLDFIAVHSNQNDPLSHS
jgi:hypothetical protein